MTGSIIGRAVEDLAATLGSGLAGPLEQLLPRSWIEESIQKTGRRFRSRVFTPWVTIWAFVGQVLDADYSLRNAVARIQALLASLGCAEISSDTGAFCRARYRLPEELLPTLCRRVGERTASQVPEEHLWRGRAVKLVDGSSVTMADTPENQQAYPQPAGQLPGVGFPVARLVAVFCMATGAVRDLAIASLQKSELALFRSLRHTFQEGEIVLADRLYSSYADIALLKRQGVDLLARLHGARKTDFRRGRALGIKDHLVIWQRSTDKPGALPARDRRRLPSWMQVRELRFRVEGDGFRPQFITLVTTLLDPVAYPASELAKLYLRRWQAEIDLASLKTTLGMEFLRGQRPCMVRAEIWAHALTYNLLRDLMLRAGDLHQVDQLRISLKGAAQHLRSFVYHWANAGRAGREFLRGRLLLLIAREQVPDRPGRAEPRQRKRRPKEYKLMTEPRAKLKARLKSA